MGRTLGLPFTVRTIVCVGSLCLVVTCQFQTDIDFARPEQSSFSLVGIRFTSRSLNITFFVVVFNEIIIIVYRVCKVVLGLNLAFYTSCVRVCESVVNLPKRVINIRCHAEFIRSSGSRRVCNKIKLQIMCC